MNLAEAILTPNDVDAEVRPRIRDAVVDGTGPLTLAIGAATAIPATRLLSYSPTIGDVVVALQTQGRIVVLGEIGA